MPLTPQAELQQIDEINAAIQQQGLNWVAGKTSVSHLSPEEKARRFGTIPKPPTPGVQIISAPIGAQDTYPTYFSWNNIGGTSDGLGGVNWMTSVKDQGCGDCWAFTAIGVVEAAYNIYTGNPNLNLDLSEQHLVSDCCPTGLCGDCNDGYYSSSFDYIKDYGVSSEECFPYRGQNSECVPCGLWDTETYRITDRISISNDTPSWKSALMEYGPLAVVIEDGEDWFCYVSGVYSPTYSAQELKEDHAIVLVGWNETIGAWIIKNSWGHGWGTDGYGYVAYDVLFSANYHAATVTGIAGPTDPNDVWTTPVSATATSIRGADFQPENSIDGLLDTAWWSAQFVGDATITYDLGELLTIDGIRMMVDEYVGQLSIDVSVSTDGYTWNLVAQDIRIALDEYYITIPFTEITSRYVSLREYDVDNSYSFCSVTEFNARVPSYNILPTAHISVEHISPAEVPATIQFTGEGIDQDGTIVSYDWEFGDGTPNSNEQNPVHVYDTSGTHVVVLTVTDNDNAIGTDIAHVRIHPSGTCELLLHYDVDDDGVISYDEAMASFGIVTDDEFAIIANAHVAGSINNFIDGCYTVAIPGINIASFTVTPLTCELPCTVAADIQWENTAEKSITFIKGYTLDGVLKDTETVTLLPGETTNLSAGVYLPDIGEYEICTYTEVTT